MSKYLCLECGNIFNIKDRKEYNYCYLSNCNGEMIELDDNMLYIIKILNQNGISKQILINNANTILCKWVLSLPYLQK